MYSASWIKWMEVVGPLTASIMQTNHDTEDTARRCVRGLAVDHTMPTPPEVLEASEAGSRLTALLQTAVTPDERRLIRMLDTLIDQMWMHSTGKGLRGELRKMWKQCGMSEWRFYAAFNAIKQREFT